MLGGDNDSCASDKTSADSDHVLKIENETLGQSVTVASLEVLQSRVIAKPRRKKSSSSSSTSLSSSTSSSSLSPDPTNFGSTSTPGIQIAQSVTSIEQCESELIDGLTKIHIPSSATSLGRGAFDDTDIRGDAKNGDEDEVEHEHEDEDVDDDEDDDADVAGDLLAEEFEDVDNFRAHVRMMMAMMSHDDPSVATHAYSEISSLCDRIH